MGRRGSAVKQIQTGITQLKNAYTSLSDERDQGPGRIFYREAERGEKDRRKKPQLHRLLIMWYLSRSSQNDDGYYSGGGSSAEAIARYDADKIAWDASYDLRGNARTHPAVLQGNGVPAAELVKNPNGVIPTGTYRYERTDASDTLSRFQDEYDTVLADSEMTKPPTKVIIHYFGSDFSVGTIAEINAWLKDTKGAEWLYYWFGSPPKTQIYYRWIYTFYQLVEHHALNFQLTEYP